MSKGKMPARNKKNFRSTKSGAGMTKKGVAAYRRLNPGSKLQTAVTGKVKKGSKAAKRRKSFCARSVVAFLGFFGWTALTLIDVDKRTEKTAVKVDQNHAMITTLWERLIDRDVARANVESTNRAKAR